MDIQGARAVVTGAASGIGEALAQRLLERGASVVLGDLDAPRLASTTARLADEHGDRVTSVAGDASDPAHIAALIAAAGDVDLFVANAGIFRGFGLDADPSDWDASWQVNVQAHVRAAQALVPGWLERGSGCFVSVASAAGLLTQLGSATYSVTKHAAVGFAQWLAATYGDQGVQVCCACPMGVQTDMLATGQASVDPAERLAMTSVVAAGEPVTALDVADVVVSAVEQGRFYALPHPSVADMHARKAADTDAWIAGMQRFRSTLT